MSGAQSLPYTAKRRPLRYLLAAVAFAVISASGAYGLYALFAIKPPTEIFSDNPPAKYAELIKAKGFVEKTLVEVKDPECLVVGEQLTPWSRSFKIRFPSGGKCYDSTIEGKFLNPQDFVNENYPAIAAIALLLMILTIFKNKFSFYKITATTRDKQVLYDAFMSVREEFSRDMLNKPDERFEVYRRDLYFISHIIMTDGYAMNHVRETYHTIIQAFNSSYLDEYSKVLFVDLQTLEAAYAFKRFNIIKWMMNRIDFLISIHKTSFSQIFAFYSLYTIVNTRILQTIYSHSYENDNFWYYLYNTVSVSSNLGGMIELHSNVDFGFMIYLQLTGLIMFGMLIGTITKSIK